MGPRKVTPQGFKRISSRLSRRLVARRRLRRRACCLLSRCHSAQYGHRTKGEKGSFSPWARKRSKRESILPPGKHKSPGCRTLSDRLFSTTHGCSRKGPLWHRVASGKRTADERFERATPLGKTGPLALSLWSTRAMWDFNEKASRSKKDMTTLSTVSK
jgi:hypothetical protein